MRFVVKQKTTYIIAGLGTLIVLVGLLLASFFINKRQETRSSANVADQPIFGLIANPQFYNQPIIATLFFPGDEKNPTITKDTKSRHTLIGSQAFPGRGRNYNTDTTFRLMKEMHINVVKFSYWGNSDKLGVYCQTNCTQQGYDETFQLAQKHDLLATPYLEVLNEANLSEIERNNFGDKFPEDTSQLESRIIYLLNKYGDNSQWLRVFDKNLEERKVFWMINTISNKPIDPNVFAKGFDTLATKIEQQTGHKIGFIIDPSYLGLYPNPDAVNGPTPETIGNATSVVGISPWHLTVLYPGEPFTEGNNIASQSDEEQKLAFYESFVTKWKASQVPLIASIEPGFDDTALPSRYIRQRYGFNTTWQQRMGELVLDNAESGINFDTWNGIYEGFVFMPSEERQLAEYDWGKQLAAKFIEGFSPQSLISPSPSPSLEPSPSPTPSPTPITSIKDQTYCDQTYGTGVTKLLVTPSGATLCIPTSQNACDIYFGTNTTTYKADYPYGCLAIFDGTISQSACDKLFEVNNTLVNNEGYCIPQNTQTCQMIFGNEYEYRDGACLK